jgi:hypothetical protein
MKEVPLSEQDKLNLLKSVESSDPRFVESYVDRSPEGLNKAFWLVSDNGEYHGPFLPCLGTTQ